MAVQQNKKSPSKRGMHRSHDFLSGPPLAVEPQTGEVHLRHHVSPNGFYRGKKVVKTTDADAAPKKRGRPAKAKEPAIEATDDLIASLASDAQSSSGSLTATPRVSTPAATIARTPSAAQSTPRKVVQVTEKDDELTEDEVEVVVTPKKSPAKPAAAPAAPKKLAAAKPKRKEITINGDKYWVEKFVDEDGDEQTINVRCSDNSAFQDEDYVGVWNNATRTLEVD